MDIKEDETLHPLAQIGTRHEPEQVTTLQILSNAIDKGMSIEIIEKMMVLNERNEANEARKAYHKAFASFKADPPSIVKDAKVKHATKGGGTKQYNHASIGNVVASIISGLGKHGLSHSWDVTQDNNGITVTCILTHELGHSERVKMVAPADPSGGKNPIQAIASTTSYLQRYTVLAITGMATNEMEDDGKGAYQEPKTSHAEAVDMWEREADKHAETVEALKEWYTSVKSTICRLPSVTKKSVNDYVLMLKQALIDKEQPRPEPKTIKCPSGPQEVTATECALCPVDDCQSRLN